MLKKFTDLEHGQRRLVEALCQQRIVANNIKMAEAIANVCELREMQPNDVLIEQHGDDSDLFLIITGAFSVFINSREVAVRLPGSHVGEMAMIDPTAKRSATVIATEHSLVAKIDEGNFSDIADKFPVAWRCISVDLASRLRERSKFVKKPNDKSMVFIGSSSENIEIAEQVKLLVQDFSMDVKIWSEPGIFKLSKAALDSLIETARGYDFSIMIFDESDVVESRSQTFLAPRDNVVFELGLFMGAIGAERSFILRPKSADLKIPSDLLGITALAWDSSNKTLSLETQCSVIKQTILEMGPK